MGILSATFVTMGSLIRDFRVNYISQRLYSSILLARSEAIKRGENVSLCRSANGSQCNPGDNWSDGWLVFYDDNGNRIVDGADQLIRVYNQISSDFLLNWNGPAEGFYFNGRGQVDFTNNYMFKLCLLGINDSAIREITVYGSYFGDRLKSVLGRGNC